MNHSRSIPLPKTLAVSAVSSLVLFATAILPVSAQQVDPSSRDPYPDTQTDISDETTTTTTETTPNNTATATPSDTTTDMSSSNTSTSSAERSADTATTTTETTDALAATTSTETEMMTSTSSVSHEHYALNDGGLTFETDLRPENEVGRAATSSDADVEGTAGVWFLPDGSEMNYWVFLEPHDELITGAHLHCGDVGENGPVIVPLMDMATTTAIMPMESGTTTAIESEGAFLRGDILASDISSLANCADTIGYTIHDMSDLAAAIQNGDIYVNIHSEDFPDGVSRGQLHHVTNYLSIDEFNRMQTTNDND
jgi:hypothetical protein